MVGAASEEKKGAAARGFSRNLRSLPQIGKDLRMQNPTVNRDLMEMRNNIRQAVNSLEVCWKCQNVSECNKYVLGHTVLVWLCTGCLSEMEKQQPERPRVRSRGALQSLPSAWKSQL